MRLWLQSSSLLAVLAGYTLLLVLNQAVATLQRIKAHKELVVQLSSVGALPVTLRLPGLQVQRLAGHQRQEPVLEVDHDARWLVSKTPLPTATGQPQVLLTNQRAS